MFSPIPNQCIWEPTRRLLIDLPIKKKRSNNLRNLKQKQQISVKKRKENSLSFAHSVVDLITIQVYLLRPFVERATRARKNNS